MNVDPLWGRDMANEIELEEWRQLQEIIARHEDHAFKVRGVLYIILAGLAAGYFSEKLINATQFVILALASTALVLLVELSHRAIVRVAINRAGKVEESLRDPVTSPYDGPRVKESLGKTNWIKELPGELSVSTTYSHYIAILAIIIVVFALRPTPSVPAGVSATQQPATRPSP